MAEKGRVEAMAVASPIVSTVTALVVSGLMVAVSRAPSAFSSPGVHTLLNAVMLMFAAGQAIAFVLGVVGTIKVWGRRESRGIPEALLGLLTVCVLSLTALVVALSVVAPSSS